MSIRKTFVFVLAAGLIFGAGTAFAAKRGSRKRKPAKARPLISKDKRFSVTLPTGFRRARGSRRGVLAWTHVADRTLTEIFTVSKSRLAGSALRTARKHRAQSARADGEEVFTSKVVKKTLANELVFYHWWSYGRDARGSSRDIFGYIEAWGKKYYVKGVVSRRASGPKTVYAVLGALRPMHTGKMERRATNAAGKPGLLKDYEEKNQGVPLY